MAMNCNQVEPLLPLVIDDAFDDATERDGVLAHIGSCETCGEDRRFLEQTVAALAYLEELPPPASLRRNVRNRIERYERRRYRRLWHDFNQVFFRRHVLQFGALTISLFLIVTSYHVMRSYEQLPPPRLELASETASAARAKPEPSASVPSGGGATTDVREDSVLKGVNPEMEVSAADGKLREVAGDDGAQGAVVSGVAVDEFKPPRESVCGGRPPGEVFDRGVARPTAMSRPPVEKKRNASPVTAEQTADSPGARGLDGDLAAGSPARRRPFVTTASPHSSGTAYESAPGFLGGRPSGGFRAKVKEKEDSLLAPSGEGGLLEANVAAPGRRSPKAPSVGETMSGMAKKESSLKAVSKLRKGSAEEGNEGSLGYSFADLEEEAALGEERDLTVSEEKKAGLPDSDPGRSSLLVVKQSEVGLQQGGEADAGGAARQAAEDGSPGTPAGVLDETVGQIRQEIPGSEALSTGGGVPNALARAVDSRDRSGEEEPDPSAPPAGGDAVQNAKAVAADSWARSEETERAEVRTWVRIDLPGGRANRRNESLLRHQSLAAILEDLRGIELPLGQTAWVELGLDSSGRPRAIRPGPGWSSGGLEDLQLLAKKYGLRFLGDAR